MLRLSLCMAIINVRSHVSFVVCALALTIQYMPKVTAVLKGIERRAIVDGAQHCLRARERVAVQVPRLRGAVLLPPGPQIISGAKQAVACPMP